MCLFVATAPMDQLMGFGAFLKDPSAMTRQLPTRIKPATLRSQAQFSNYQQGCSSRYDIEQCRQLMPWRRIVVTPWSSLTGIWPVVPTVLCSKRGISGPGPLFCTGSPNCLVVTCHRTCGVIVFFLYDVSVATAAVARWLEIRLLGDPRLQ